ncbi:hypothetical protein BKA62DRAFT_772963 [Auriculariales sp. MPI-PUGE-AT-0066]|nr:hypothetical protein BKA62DRAFT_772963 [Auriculariales sp. MPI-PUGE-AT-0066]
MPLPESPEELSALIVAACNTAAIDGPPTTLLSDILSELDRTDAERRSDLLEPLVIVPALVQILSDSEPPLRMLKLLARDANAKECVLAFAEELERLCSAIDQIDEDVEDQVRDGKRMADAVVRLVQAVTVAAPRVALRKRSLHETSKPWVKIVQRAVRVLSGAAFVSRGSVVEVLQTDLTFAEALKRRAEDEGIASDDKLATEVRLQSHVISSVDNAYTKLQAHLALRLYESQNSRLILRSGVPPGWESDDAVLTRASDFVQSIDNFVQPSFGSLVILVHHANFTASSSTVSTYMPILIAYLQANQSIDAPLALLLRYLSNSTTQTQSIELPEPLAAALIPLVAPLSAAHPHPPTRLLLFRGLLKPMLLRTPPALRLSLYAGLLSPDETAAYPQLRVAAIALVRDDLTATLRAGGGGAFAGPRTLQTLAPLVLRPSPPNLFEQTDLDVHSFVQEAEPARLTEALLFYYAVLVADTANKTGIRDKDTLRSVDRDLLQPLRQHVPKWIAKLQASDTHSHGHAVMALAGLETALERVDEARATL